MTPLEKEIEARLHVMDAYFPLQNLLEKKIDSKAVAKYYRKSDYFYKKIHGRGSDAIHMGLSEDGFFKKDDFLGQARFVGTLLNHPGMNILELGAGRLVNTRYLATELPQNHYTALDLPNRNFLKNKVPSNVTLMEGDYHDLSAFPEASFDLVFGVETVCHAADKDKVLGEVVKVLKPGGKLVLFDVYEPKSQEKMSDFEKRVSTITLAGMCVTPKDHYIGLYMDRLAAHGFTDIQVKDLTWQIRPSLRRLDRISCFYFMHPRFLDFTRRHISEDIILNSIAGWLMLLTFDGENIHQYNRIVATKPQ